MHPTHESARPLQPLHLSAHAHVEPFKMRPLWQEVQTVGEKEHVAHGDWQAGQDGAVWAYPVLHLTH